MSDYNTAYQVACAPGPNAAAAVTRGPGGMPVLVVYLDPVNMTLHSEPSQTGVRELASFCRELAREAGRLAAEIDPDGEPAPPERHPRHLLVTGDDGDSGGGY
jgi:hypothetical protein